MAHPCLHGSFVTLHFAPYLGSLSPGLRIQGRSAIVSEAQVTAEMPLVTGGRDNRLSAWELPPSNRATSLLLRHALLRVCVCAHRRPHHWSNQYRKLFWSSYVLPVVWQRPAPFTIHNKARVPPTPLCSDLQGVEKSSKHHQIAS